MIKQGFYIGNRDWWIMCYYDIRTEKELEEVAIALYASGCQNLSVKKATKVLENQNSGYTFTNGNEHVSLVFISHATSAEELYDTIQHELKHVVEHIGEYYGIDSRSERSAYLQGEIARNMFAAATYVVCPKCNGYGTSNEYPM